MIPYVKGLLGGVVALVLYIVFVPFAWMTARLFAAWLGSLPSASSGGGTFRGGAHAWVESFNLKSPSFLALAVMVFVASFYWELRRAAAIQK